MALYLGRKLIANIQRLISWGNIQGTLSDQTDLQNALNAKVPTSRTVNGKALSSDITLTASDVGALTEITSSGVIEALGYTPYDSSNPEGYINEITSSGVIEALGYTPYDDSNPDGFISEITSSGVIEALGYTPYDSANPDGFISEITSSGVIEALGYTPYDDSNPDGFISEITSSGVIEALGYTPYDNANPSGYTSNTGTVTSVNNVQPVSGNVTLGASDVGSLASSTKYGADLSYSNSQLQLVDQDGSALGNAVTISGGGGGTWGSITGTLSNQTDLQNALNAKLNSSDVQEYTANEIETLWGSI